MFTEIKDGRPIRRIHVHVEMEKLDEIMQCSICLGKLSDPRILPCIHTFCCGCLQATADQSYMRPGDQMGCPVCRNEFRIPDNGIQAVKKNVFIVKLLEARALSERAKESTSCHICARNCQGLRRRVPKAVMYCMVCQENMCDSCFEVHRAQRLSINHKVVKAGSKVREEEIRAMLPTTNCDKHLGKPLDYFCVDCNRVVCVNCFVESHTRHDCRDVNSVHEEFQREIQNKGSEMRGCVDDVSAKKRNLKEKKQEFLQNISLQKRNILERKKELTALLEQQTSSLLQSLDAIKQNRLKEMEDETQELEAQVMIFNSFQAYCNELISKGSPSDICHNANDLQVRASDLKGKHDLFLQQSSTSIEVLFHATEMTDSFNMVGRIEESNGIAVLPSDFLPSEVLPSDFLPSDFLPSEVLPSDLLPSDPLPTTFSHHDSIYTINSRDSDYSY